MIVATLDRALEALKHQDVELAQIVISDDDRIDGRYLEVHQGILILLATQAPVATDLRAVAALLHVIKHVERMGDQCVNIAKLIPITGHEPPVDDEMLATVLRMGELAISEVRQAKQAFELRDVGLAQDLVRQDEVINQLNREVFRMASAREGRRGPPRVGDDHGAGRPRARARGRQRRRHRRAGGVRGDRALPRVQRRVAPPAELITLAIRLCAIARRPWCPTQG